MSSLDERDGGQMNSSFRLTSVHAAMFGALLAGCSTQTMQRPEGPRIAQVMARPTLDAHDLALISRLSWGVSPALAKSAAEQGMKSFIDHQLHPAADDGLPPDIRSQIAAFRISQESVEQLANEISSERRQVNMIAEPERKMAAQKSLQDGLNQLAREAGTRTLLRDLYSANQLQELISWFWLNHFNVYLPKNDIRLFIADYEDKAIRPHALGKFRDLLSATLHHPAMLRYLDNDQNADKRINENYARELMELHTLGVNGGYTQKDVQELARILTGVGVNETSGKPQVRPALQLQYIRNGAFEFNPNRHDYGNKIFLGHEIKGSGLPEIDEALDILAHHPSTARFISRKLAVFFVSDDPPPAFIDRLAETFRKTDGNIASVLTIMFASPEFEASLGSKFKDPMHFTISAVRLAYGDKLVLNTQPIRNWLNRMAEPLYGHETPDGYPLGQAAWAGPGAMATRFEIARAIGSGSAGLFKAEGPDSMERPAFPQIAGPLYFESIGPTLAANTSQTLDQAISPQDWNTLFLSSPDFMHW
jgi:uncharacterized protein (DUF1800 family)